MIYLAQLDQGNAARDWTQTLQRCAFPSLAQMRIDGASRRISQHVYDLIWTSRLRKFKPQDSRPRNLIFPLSFVVPFIVKSNTY